MPSIHTRYDAGLLLNIELELKSEKENSEIRLSDPLQYQSIVDTEWNIIYDKLDKCVKSGAKIVLSRLAIGDLATHVYFADRDIFCAGRVSEEDLHRVAAATSGTVQTSVNNVIDETIEALSIIPVPELALRLYLQCAEAANDCDIEPVAYEFFTQAYILYEEEISDVDVEDEHDEDSGDSNEDGDS